VLIRNVMFLSTSILNLYETFTHKFAVNGCLELSYFSRDCNFIMYELFRGRRDFLARKSRYCENVIDLKNKCVTKGHYIISHIRKKAGVTLESNSQGDWTHPARLFRHGSSVCIYSSILGIFSYYHASFTWNN